MTDYTKLVEALRYCVSGVCKNCSYFDKCKENGTDMAQLHNDAADAIEALRFELDCVNDSIKQLALPVDGKWVRVEDGDSWHYECSRCRERPLYSLYGDIVLSGTCPFCGAKLEVQE